jgi:hypothetical protein
VESGAEAAAAGQDSAAEAAAAKEEDGVGGAADSEIPDVLYDIVNSPGLCRAGTSGTLLAARREKWQSVIQLAA